MKEHHSSIKSTSMRKFIHRFRRRQQEWSKDDPSPTTINLTDVEVIEDEVNVDDNLSSNLPTEIHLKIFAFLDIQSLNTMMITNRTWHSFLQSPDAQHWLWWNHCQRIWNLDVSEYDNDDEDNNDSLWNLNLIDDLKNDDNNDISDSSSSSGSNLSEEQEREHQHHQVPNLHGLLSRTPHHPQQPLLPTTMNPLFGRTSPLKAFEDGGILTLRIIHDYNSHQAFSARADYPLTRPSFDKNKSKKTNKRDNKLVQSLEKCKDRFLFFKKRHPQWNAFVSPYSIFGESLSNIHVTPRLVSYFEITVEETCHLEPPELTLLQRRLASNHPSSWIQDCVVIGLAPTEFDSRMDLPGWDGDSFGYHSDTGGLYHGGFYGIGATHENTEPFGTGDTVGMGIDYVRRGVFVTKNGKMLGLFFDRLKVDYLASTDLYPVVGMDSKDTVVVNYGGCGKPFLFDLANYCQVQQQELPPKRRIPRT